MFYLKVFSVLIWKPLTNFLNSMSKLFVISGPTATGKTALSIKLAKLFNGVVVNFDSLLFYQELEIGNARPTLAEMDGVPHFLVGNTSAKTPLNANSFCKLAQPIIEENFKSQKNVFLVGGSGFYLRALLKGMFEDLSTPAEVSQRSNQLYKDEGITPFIKVLSDQDPQSLKKLHLNDHYRLRRAAEYFWTTGNPISASEKKFNNSVNQKGNIHGWDELHFHLDLPKNIHYEFIQKRTQKMFDSGLLEEVKSLLAQGFTGEEKPLQSIGYKEMFDFLKGEIKTIADCQERISISTRQLAKSQRTWFKKIEKFEFNPLTDEEKIISLVRSKCQAMPDSYLPNK